VTIFDHFFSFKKSTREFVTEYSFVLNSENGEDSPQNKSLLLLKSVPCEKKNKKK
jgi:hypothetical protein